MFTNCPPQAANRACLERNYHKAPSMPNQALSELPMTYTQWQILDSGKGVTPHGFSGLKNGNGKLVIGYLDPGRAAPNQNQPSAQTIKPAADRPAPHRKAMSR